MMARLVDRTFTTTVVFAAVVIPLVMGVAAHAGAVHPLVAALVIGLAGYIVRDVRRSTRRG